MSQPMLLGVNIDHVATIRMARGTDYPSVLDAARVAEAAGADAITVHLREDRRHIQDAEVEALCRQVSTRVNLEMAVTDEMLAIAEKNRPADVCLVPEKRQELTTEGGLDVAGQVTNVKAACRRLADAGIRVSLFIDPDREQLDASAECGAPVVELHTGAYADAADAAAEAELRRVAEASAYGQGLGLQVNAGHGLHYDNVRPVVAIPELVELNIGHAIVARALFVGLDRAVREMRDLMARARRLPAEPFEVRVTTLDDDGAGRAEHEGRALRVWGGLPGETVRAQYLFGRRFRGQARAVEVLEPAPERVTPPCPHFGTCSACAFQHLDDDAQLAFKQDLMLRRLQAAGAPEPGRLLPPLDAQRWHYRRKARLSVRDVPAKGRVLVGFRERDGRFVTDMTECHTLAAPIASQLEALSTLIGALDARATVPQIEAACGDQACVLIFRHLEPLSGSDRAALADFEDDTGLKVYLQPKGPETVHPLTDAATRLQYALPAHDVDIVFEPLDFIQVNAALNRLMVGQALDLLDVGPDDRVLDLFCGLGNFTLPLARRAAAVTGLEGAGALVERARRNARRNGIDNAEFQVMDLYSGALDADWPARRYDAVLLDPPRSGAAPLLERIRATGAARVVYVSCNPESLAADAAALTAEHGFDLAAVGIMDMFPHTAHVESMALFERR